MRRPPLTIALIMLFLMNSWQGLSYAEGTLDLPLPKTRITLTPAYSPIMMRGLRLNPKNPLRFDFIIDQGAATLENDALKSESMRLIKYFMAALTLKEKDLWVNLSPYEKDRIIPEPFAATEMGRDLLGEDYVLKQLTSSLLYPEEEVGRNFWKELYRDAAKRFGTTQVPINTYNKVWIVPDKAQVYANGNIAYVVKSHLKVMLEEDYLALSKQVLSNKPPSNNLAAGMIRSKIIPILEKEINEGSNFTKLRQAYAALILATWFRRHLKESILGRYYVGQDKITGIDLANNHDKQKIYERYLKAFKAGVYNYVKEEMDPLRNEMIPRRYFSGGIPLTGIGSIVGETRNKAQISDALPQGRAVVVTADMDRAMHSDGPNLNKRPFSLKQAVSFGPRRLITRGVYDSDASVDIDATAIGAFQSAVSQLKGMSPDGFKALLPYLNYFADRPWDFKNKDDQRQLAEITARLNKAVPISAKERGTMIAVLQRILGDLPQESYQKLLRRVADNVRIFLRHFSKNLKDLTDFDVELAINADESFEIVRQEGQRPLLRVDAGGFTTLAGTNANIFELNQLAVREKSREAYLALQAQGGVSAFVANNERLVHEIIYVLYAMNKDIDYYYGIADYGGLPLNKQQRDARNDTRRLTVGFLRDNKAFGYFLSIFKRLGRIYAVDGQGRKRADIPRRIEAVLRFVGEHRSLAEAVNGEYGGEDIRQIAFLFDHVMKQSVAPVPASMQELSVEETAGGQSPLETFFVKLLEEKYPNEDFHVPVQIIKENLGIESDNLPADFIKIRNEIEPKLIFKAVHHPEQEYLDKIQDGHSRMLATEDQRQRAIIFFEAVWPNYLLALANADTTVRIDGVVRAAIALLQDASLQAALGQIMGLSAQPATNEAAIKVQARAVRENQFLVGHRIHVDIRVIDRLKGPLVSEHVSLLSASAYHIDEIQVFDIDGHARSIRLLGERIDALDQTVKAMGYVMFGDTHAVVIKQSVREQMRRQVLPYLRAASMQAPRGIPMALYNLMRDAYKIDFPITDDEMVFESSYRSTAVHELQHLEDELRGVQAAYTDPIQKRVAQEITAHLRSIADMLPDGKPNVPFSELAQLVDQFLDYQLNPLRMLGDMFRVYEKASAHGLVYLAHELNVEITAEQLYEDRMAVAHMILSAALKLSRVELTQAAQRALAKAIEEQKTGKSYLVRGQEKSSQAQDKTKEQIISILDNLNPNDIIEGFMDGVVVYNGDFEPGDIKGPGAAVIPAGFPINNFDEFPEVSAYWNNGQDKDKKENVKVVPWGLPVNIINYYNFGIDSWSVKKGLRGAVVGVLLALGIMLYPAATDVVMEFPPLSTEDLRAPDSFDDTIRLPFNLDQPKWDKEPFYMSPIEEPLPPLDEQIIPARPNPPMIHMIQKGDNIWNLAVRFYGSPSKANMDKIRKANPHLQDRRLPIGDFIIIPDPVVTKGAQDKLGGIDFNVEGLDIETQGQADSFYAALDPQVLHAFEFQPPEGLKPTIICVTPVNDVKTLLGV